jgi:predicted permease
LRRRGLAEQRDGNFLFKLYFYICSPALMFTALSSVDLEPKLTHLRVSAAALSIRLGVGLVLAVGAIGLFHLHGAERGVMLLLAVAPVGFNTVTFASLETLDVEFASGVVSISLIVGFVLTSITALAFL